jgi:hypothetical protein
MLRHLPLTLGLSINCSKIQVLDGQKLSAINQAGPGSHQWSLRNWHTTWWQLNAGWNIRCLTKSFLEEIQDHGVLPLRQGYSKYGPRSRIRTAKRTPSGPLNKDRQSVLTKNGKVGFLDLGSLWKFVNVDLETNSLSIPSLRCSMKLEMTGCRSCIVMNSNSWRWFVH